MASARPARAPAARPAPARCADLAARHRARSFHVRADAFPQPRARPHLRRDDGGGAGGAPRDLALLAGHDRPLRRACAPRRPRAVEADPSPHLAPRALGGGSDRARPVDPVPRRRPCGGDPRPREPLRFRRHLWPAVEPALARPRLQPIVPARRGVAARRHRPAFLAPHQGLVRALEPAPSGPGGDDPDRRLDRLDGGCAPARPHGEPADRPGFRVREGRSRSSTG